MKREFSPVQLERRRQYGREYFSKKMSEPGARDAYNAGRNERRAADPEYAERVRTAARIAERKRREDPEYVAAANKRANEKARLRRKKPDAANSGLSLPNESWRVIDSFPAYEVSDFGRIYSRHRGHMLSPDKGRAGHLRVTLRGDGIKVRKLVHRLVLEAFVGPPPEDYQCCHNDGEPSNNSVTNLRWDTAAGNARDTVKHGRNKWANQTHCAHGHLFDAQNTIWETPRRRRCRKCKNDKAKRYYQAKKLAS